MPAIRLTVYLLDSAISRPTEAVNSGRAPTATEMAADFGVDGTFYSTSRPATAPSWVSYLRPLLQGEPPDLRSSSASGLLILKASERFFAITFGYGRSLLDLSKIQHGFGLRVALNRIDPAQIRSMDTKTFEDMVVTKNTQTSRSSDLPSFGVDVSRDILRAVTGEPRDSALANRISGSDAVVIAVDRPPTALPELCSELLDAYREDNYLDQFSWIDHLSLVANRGIQDELDRQLLEQLRVGETSSTHLAMPEVLDWEDIDSFTITGARGVEYDDLDLDAYLAHTAVRRESLTLTNLKDRRIGVRFNRTGDFDKRWTLYQCLVSEQRLDSGLYALIEGRWFSISPTIAAEVDAFTDSLEKGTITLADARRGESEADYNRRAATADPGRLLLLDTRINRPGGATTGIEFCDLLGSAGELIHVKRKSRSSTLSHLFAQGTVSATTFLRDGEFRDQIRTDIEKAAAPEAQQRWLDLIPSSDQKLDRSAYAVTFVVIANTSRKGNDWLPFFSKLNLMHAARQLNGAGINLRLQRVPVAEQAPDILNQGKKVRGETGPTAGVSPDEESQAQDANPVSTMAEC